MQRLAYIVNVEKFGGDIYALIIDAAEWHEPHSCAERLVRGALAMITSS